QCDREGRYVVRPQIKGAAAFEIKAGMVPMTGQNAVLDAAPLEREAHVRATIVESEHATIVVDDKDRTMAAVEDEPPFRLELLKATGEHKFPIWLVHQYAPAQLIAEHRNAFTLAGRLAFAKIRAKLPRNTMKVRQSVTLIES